MSLRFGTDGVRGVANSELTPEYVLALGRAAARVLDVDRLVIGRDTRASGPLLESALAAGAAAEGVNVELAGIVPTPAVAYLAGEGPGRAGAVISASHNPYGDNGVKLFAAGGLKLPDAVEQHLEAELDRLVVGWLKGSESGSHSVPTGATVGRVTRLDRREARSGYEAAVVASVEGRRFDGLHVVIDVANGAAFETAPSVLRQLGATVEVLSDKPDGCNINDGCGSLHPQTLAAEVVACRAHVGLAFDGDADRLIAVDHRGHIVDGDQLIAVLALDRHARGVLRGDAVVVTVMTNLGFRRAMQARGISVVETTVGDRYVLEALDAKGLSLGGEQSGHVIFRDLATTGDGLLTGVQLLDAVVRLGKPLGDLAAASMTRLPQVLKNVALPARRPDLLEELTPAIRSAEEELAGQGRVLVRFSGTEPLVRVMVEAPTDAEAHRVVEQLVASVRRLAGAA